MAGFEWKSPEYVEEWRAKEKTPEEQILFELMDHVMSTGKRLGLMSGIGDTKKDMIEADIPHNLIRRMQAVSPGHWLSKNLPPIGGACRLTFQCLDKENFCKGSKCKRIGMLEWA